MCLIGHDLFDENLQDCSKISLIVCIIRINLFDGCLMKKNSIRTESYAALNIFWVIPYFTRWIANPPISSLR